MTLKCHGDLVINPGATTVDTVCVGSIILILVTSKYRRIACKMLFFCLFARQFRLCCCDYFICFDFAQVPLRHTCLTFDSKISLFYCLFRYWTLNHLIKYILPVRWFSPYLPVTNGILILACVVLVAENNRSVT